MYNSKKPIFELDQSAPTSAYREGHHTDRVDSEFRAPSPFVFDARFYAPKKCISDKC